MGKGAAGANPGGELSSARYLHCVSPSIVGAIAGASAPALRGTSQAGKEHPNYVASESEARRGAIYEYFRRSVTELLLSAIYSQAGHAHARTNTARSLAA